MRFRISRDTVIALSLLALILGLRLWRLDADPPADVSGSTDIYTDPPQYTLYAANYVEAGEFNPYHDNRYVFFLKSSVTVLATVVFKLVGTGMVESKLVGLIYSFGGLLFFFLFLRRTAGHAAGLIYLALIGLNFSQFFFGRFPFLENAMWFYAALSLLLVTHARNPVGYAAGGAALAVAVFFGKITGIVFLFPFACMLLHEALVSDKKAGRFRPAIFYVSGFALVMLFWIVFSYLPTQQEVTGYIGEKTLSLYGSPEGLQSFDDFVWKLVSFGVNSELFPRMTTAALLGAVYVGYLFFHAGRLDMWRRKSSAVSSGQLFVAAMIVAFYGSLMIWNYQPLRYEMVLIYPFCGAAAILLARWWAGFSTSATRSNIPWLFPVMLFPIVMVVVSQSWSAMAERWGWPFAFDEVKFEAAGIAAILTLLTVVTVILVRRYSISLPQMAGRVVVIIAFGSTIGQGAALGVGWFNWTTYTMRDNSADLGMILSPGAVLSGPYAATLTQDNDLGCIIHMFGVVEVDTTLFARFPITHLLLDEANEQRARNDHPYVMGGAVRICAYRVGRMNVRLYRIAGHTGNPTADSYQLSTFEKLVDSYRSGESDQVAQYLQEFTETYPNSMSGYLLAANMAQTTGQYAEAEQLLKKAIEFSPTNYNLIGTLAVLYKNRYDATGSLMYKNLALQKLERALKFAPTSNRMKALYAELKGPDSDG
ncbi:MAG: tetratricopeptide repeat protein [candidate division Zixibacteria bacterium]|nr:tetratricopeptide repeat protein [candidate division Zixibacteria bacterium]MDH3936813.1 tetratricopeptide repeat protein [candidate division Zixibacteria bacterium]MDH4035447.1 tetratricopeptide repeat protein [candidate division Zixibacteria bacterium]